MTHFPLKLPKFLRIPIVGILKCLDSHGMLPKSITDDNLYYSSAILSNIGTFKVFIPFFNFIGFPSHPFL